MIYIISLMILSYLFNKSYIIDIYYFTQLFFISLYTSIPIYLLIIQSFVIYYSSKKKNNFIIRYIEQNIHNLNIYLWIFMTIIYLINNNPIVIHKIFILLSMIFYNISLYHNVIDKYVYLSFCLSYLLPTKI
jgi:hypothetical protein